MPPKPTKGTGTDASKCVPSSFTLTFVVEVIGIDVFHDCNEGWIDLGNGPVQGLKLQYQLNTGQTYAVDIVIWPHTAKIWAGMNAGWVRTWFFLQRRWLAFTIAHMFPVRVEDFRYQIATVTPSYGLGNVGSNAKSEKTTEVYLPKITFGQRRQFAPVIDDVPTLLRFIIDLIWSIVDSFIPASYTDTLFDIPYPVKDKRHQDAVIEHVQELILNQELPRELEETVTMSKVEVKGKEKKKPEVIKHEIFLSGDKIICGTGRIIPFESVGEKPPDVGEIIVLIASASLPAPDDNPVVFFNIGQLTDVPIKELLMRNITELYTKWTISDEEHTSEPQHIKKSKEINFNDHHAVPLALYSASDSISSFLETDYRIELHGIRSLPSTNTFPNLFGYEKGDRDYPSPLPPKLPNVETDILIGTTKIDCRELTTKVNALIRGDFPIYPLEVTVMELQRDRICTNDMNAVRAPLIPQIIVPTDVILEAQMTLEVSIGLVGCKPHKHTRRYSRLYDLVYDTEAIMAVLSNITEINDHVMETGNREDLLSGFALDTGNTVLLYVEGPRDRQILRVWEITADFFPEMKPIFSTSVKYHTRLYPDFPKGAVPFVIMKMFVPLSVLLACPPIYARPALPLLTRHAVLKLGRLITCKRLDIPDAHELPTTAELRSFRLEFCVAPRPPPVLSVGSRPSDQPHISEELPIKMPPIAQKINWEVSDDKGKAIFK